MIVKENWGRDITWWVNKGMFKRHQNIEHVVDFELTLDMYIRVSFGCLHNFNKLSTNCSPNTTVCTILKSSSTFLVIKFRISANHRTPAASSIPARLVVIIWGNWTNLSVSRQHLIDCVRGKISSRPTNQAFHSDPFLFWLQSRAVAFHTGSLHL